MLVYSAFITFKKRVTLPVTSSLQAVKGYIDTFDAGTLSGWVYNPTACNTPTSFFVALDGQILAQGLAQYYRADLAEAGLGDGRCAFSIECPIPMLWAAGKTITLLSDDHQPIVGAELHLPVLSNRLSFEFLSLSDFKLNFLCESTESESIELVLTCDSETITTKTVELQQGENYLTLGLPSHLATPIESFFALSFKGAPYTVWSGHLSIPAPLAQVQQNPTSSAKITNRLLENRLTLLSKNTHQANPQDAVRALDAYAAVEGLEDRLINLSTEDECLYTVVLPINLPLAEVRKMVGALSLSAKRAHFDVFWLTREPGVSASTLTALNINNLHIHSIHSEQSDAQGLWSVLNRIRTKHVIFCPQPMEFESWGCERLVEGLRKVHIAFSTLHLSDEHGSLVDTGVRFSELATERNMFTALNKNSGFQGHKRAIDYTVHSCSCFRLEQIKHLGVARNCSSLHDTLFYWQTQLRRQGFVGLNLGHMQCFSEQVQCNTGAVISEALFQEAQSVLNATPELSIVSGKPISGTVLMLDGTTPSADKDAGSYAALQEIQLIQALGYKVVFLPLDLKHSGVYTQHLESQGVQVCYAPFYRSTVEALMHWLPLVKAIYVTRYNVAQQCIDLIKNTTPTTPVIFNNADLHFLREIRSALAMTENNNSEQITADQMNKARQKQDVALVAAERTKQIEIDVMRKVDAILSYNEAEHAVITSYLLKKENIFKCPWVLPYRPEPLPFDTREGIAFLGGFRHLPNVEAVDYFFQHVYPKLKISAPHIKVYIYGSFMPESFNQYQDENVVLVGYVKNLEDVFLRHRIFIAPLKSGAGIKGKVLESASYGLPSVLSPIAAEGTGLFNNISALIAESPDDWVNGIIELYSNQLLWQRLSENSQCLAREQYSFETGLVKMRKVFNYLNLKTDG